MGHYPVYVKFIIYRGINIYIQNFMKSRLVRFIYKNVSISTC